MTATFAALPLLDALATRTRLLAVLIGGLVLGIALGLGLSVNSDHPVFSQALPATIAGATVMLSLVMACWNLVLVYYMASSFEKDLPAVLAANPQLSGVREQLAVQPRDILVNGLGVLVVVAIMSHYSDPLAFGVTPGLRYLQVFAEGPAMVFQWYVAQPIFCALHGYRPVGTLSPVQCAAATG